MSEEVADKTEAPTPHKRAEARREGNIARSSELSAAVMGIGAILLLQHAAPKLGLALQKLMAEGLSLSSAGSNVRAIQLIGVSAAPMLIGMILLGVAANLLQGGWVFKFRTDNGALNPAKGVARIFSGRSRAQLFMNVIKLALAGVVTYFATRSRMIDLVTLQNRPLHDAIPAATGLFFAVATRLGLLLLVLGVIDYAYQRFRHERELRMTRREVKDEMRRLEGDPLQRGRRRQLAATMSAAKVQRDVMLADVVIASANDAVAIRYDRSSMFAPRVVVKGKGAAAQQIRDAAKRLNVAIVDRSELATNLFSTVGIGRELPARFFDAVAEVLAYVYELKGKRPS